VTFQYLKIKLSPLLFPILCLLEISAQAEITPKIVGGEPAPLDMYAFQVSLVYSNLDNNRIAHFCGGTLIKFDTVVTAAHCLDDIDRADTFKILVGTQDLEEGGERINVRSFVKHRLYKSKTFDYDVAVIKLAPTPQQKIILTKIPKATLALSRPSLNTKVWVSGWGTTGENGWDNPRWLQHVDLSIIPWATCLRQYLYGITGRMICAGVPEGGKDSCQGDSGGPLLSERRLKRTTSRDVLVGIVSWGTGCARAESPGVYTDVSTLRNWILEKAK